MARRISNRDLARICRQFDHIQDYYRRKENRQAEREISSARAIEQTQGANEMGDPSQNTSDEQPLTPDGSLDCPEIQWES